MKRTCVYLVALLLTASAVRAEQVALTLHPSGQPASAKVLHLLPRPEQLAAADAVPLYDKAARSLPANLDEKQVRQWLRAPVDTLPANQVQSTLDKAGPALKLLEQATKCKQCNWPAVTAGTMLPNLREYRSLAQVLALKARYEIARGRFDNAVNTMGTGLAAAKHIGESPVLVQGLVGVSIGALTLKQVEEFVQHAGAPNLYEALRRLPRPLVDLDKTIAAEIKALRSNPQYNVLVRMAMERNLKPAHDRVRLLMNRMVRHVAVLQCVEALRLHAGAQKGKFPDALTDITQVPVPNDPITKKPFAYTRAGAEAVLAGPAPKGADAKEAISYRLTLKE